MKRFSTTTNRVVCAQLDVVEFFEEQYGLGIYSQTQYLGRSKVALFSILLIARRWEMPGRQIGQKGTNITVYGLFPDKD